MARIELSLRLRLIKDALSSVLTEAGFTVCLEPGHHDSDTIVIVDFADCKDPESVRAHQLPGVKIVALTSGADSREIGFDEMAPLSGILTYDLPVDAFLRSLRLIGSGERVFPADVARRAQAPAPGAEPRSNGAHLSPREKEILSDVVAGHSNKMIARHLDITEATVKVHLKSVLRKIRMENRTQAAIWALANLPELKTTPRSFV